MNRSYKRCEDFIFFETWNNINVMQLWDIYAQHNFDYIDNKV